MTFGWKGWLGMVLSAVLIWFTLRGVELSEVWNQIQIANFYLLAAAIAVAVAGYLIRAIRWRILLQPIDPDTSLRNRFRALVIGFMANNLLPARIGEFARAWVFAKLEPRVSASAAFGSLVVERILDGLVLGGFLVGATLTPGFPSDQLGPGFAAILRAAMTLLGVMLAVLLLLLLLPRPVVRVAEAVSRAVLPASVARSVVDALHAFLGSLAVVRSPVLLAQALLWTVGFWLWHGLSFYLGMLAFGIDLGMVAALFTEAVVGFGVALPAAPGFFGTFHISAQFALETVYGAGAFETLAFAYAYHLGGFIPITLLGLWYVRSVGVSLSEVGRSTERVEEEVEAAHGEPGEGSS